MTQKTEVFMREFPRRASRDLRTNLQAGRAKVAVHKDVGERIRHHRHDLDGDSRVEAGPEQDDHTGVVPDLQRTANASELCPSVLTKPQRAGPHTCTAVGSRFFNSKNSVSANS